MASEIESAFKTCNAILLAILIVSSCVPSVFGSDFRDRIGYHMYFSGTAEREYRGELSSLTKEVGDWILIPASWWEIQPDSLGVLNETNYRFLDADIDSALSHNLRIILQVFRLPSFARLPGFQNCTWCDEGVGCDQCCYSALMRDPKVIDKWRSFCGNLVSRYLPRGINCYEIGNEPNDNHFYRYYNNDRSDTTETANPRYGDLAVDSLHKVVSYVEFFQMASDTMHNWANTHQYGDSLIVIGGALCPGNGIAYFDEDTSKVRFMEPTSYLEKMYLERNFDESWFDALSYHPYGPWKNERINTDPLIVEYDAEGKIQDYCTFMVTEELHSILTTHGDSLVQIWGTECGPSVYPNDPFSPDNFTEDLQAFWSDRYLQQWMEWEFTGPLLWWNLHEQTGHYDGYGAIRNDWSKRPAYQVWKEWGNSSPESFEFHIGEGPDFLFHDLDADLASRLMDAASISDTVRIFFHGKVDPYFGSADLLRLDTLSASTSLNHLAIVGVGADRNTTEAAIPGAVVIDALWDSSHLLLGEHAGLSIQNITFQHVYNSDTPREGDPTVISFIHSNGGNVHLENCQFIDVSTGGTGTINPGGVLTYAAPEGVSGFVHFKNCLFVDCAGEEAGIADVTRGIVTVESSTFHQSIGSSGRNCSIQSTSGSVRLRNCLFTGSSDASATSVQLDGGGSLQANYCLFDTQASGYNMTGVGNQFMAPGEAMEQVRYVDTDQGDFRLRWDSACLDIGDPDPAKLDFDLTRSDIGWSPNYPVIEITGLTEITEPGHYMVEGGSATLSGQNTVLPDGTTVKMEESGVLLIQDTNPTGGHSITVGEADGARTAIVGPATTGYILFGVSGTGVDAADCQFHGVLFNRLLANSFLRFRNCDVDLNGANGNVIFNDYANAEIQFHAVCRGAFRNFDFTAPQIEGGTMGIGSLTLIASDIDLLNVTFDPVPVGEDPWYWKVWLSGMAPGNPHQVIAGCTIPCNDNTYGVYPLFAQDAAFTLHHNQFTNIEQGAIYTYASTLDLANGAVNTFDKPYNQDFNGNSIIIGWGGNVNLHCGYNSFIYPNIPLECLLVEASCFSGDWRSNFWGLNCSTPFNPGPYLPICVTNYSPTLNSCPTLITPCEDQTGEETPLYALGTEADAEHNYEAACAYWTELMVEFPESKYCVKVTGSMKAIGLVTEYGMESYSLVRSDLEAAAAQSDPVDFLLSVSQRCAAWCVEARHGDRPAALGLLNLLLAQVEGNKEAKLLINAAIAEIGTYPLQGATSATNPGMEIARFEQQTQQLRAFQLALLPEATRARIAQEGLEEDEPPIQPNDFQIIGCYPNPFNPVATIELVCRGDVPLSIEVYNLAGQRVATLQDGMLSAGSHRIQWDASTLASGIYFVRAAQGAKQEISKLMLIR